MNLSKCWMKMVSNQLIVVLIVIVLSVLIKAQESTTAATTEIEVTTESELITTTELIVDKTTTNDYSLIETINDITTTESSETTTTIKSIEIVDYTSEIFNRDCLNIHNQLRSRHGVGPLKMDDKIINFARSRASTLASLNDTSYLLHATSSYGENLAAWPLIVNKSIVNCSEVVSIWFDEYKYVSNWSNEESFTPYTYHFTQIVWSSSVSLGCGAAAIKDSNWLFICCNYDPPGNYLDSFVNNVKPSIDQGTTINETVNEVHHPTQIGKNCKCTCQVEL